MSKLKHSGCSHSSETWFEWFSYHALSLFLALGLSLLSLLVYCNCFPSHHWPLQPSCSAVIVVSVYRPSIAQLKRF